MKYHLPIIFSNTDRAARSHEGVDYLLFLLRHKTVNHFEFLRDYFLFDSSLVGEGGVYIASKHDYRKIQFTYLLICIYHSLCKHRKATKDNVKDQPIDLFVRLLGVNGYKLHGTERRKSSWGFPNLANKTFANWPFANGQSPLSIRQYVLWIFANWRECRRISPMHYIEFRQCTLLGLSPTRI